MNNYRIAVLIDGDNANPKTIGNVLSKVSEFGEIIIKRVYGDFSLPHLSNWKNYSNSYTIKTMHTYNYTKGKNSTDIHLTIDTLDILYQNPTIDIFFIVSSDCDFTAVAHRVKESGKRIVGIGKNHTCNSFREACDIFINEDGIEVGNEEIETHINRESLEQNETIYRVKPVLEGIKVVGKIEL
jgi:uncharacterized protein (TIGR00288 family)